MSSAHCNSKLGDAAGSVSPHGFRECLNVHAVHLFLRLKRDFYSLASSFYEEAIRSARDGDRLRAAKFYGKSARACDKMKEYEVAADHFCEQGRMLMHEAHSLRSIAELSRRPSLVILFDPPRYTVRRAVDVFVQAARAFENAAESFKANEFDHLDGREYSNIRKARSSAGKCYVWAAEAALDAVDSRADVRYVSVSTVRWLYEQAASAYYFASDWTKSDEASRQAERVAKLYG